MYMYVYLGKDYSLLHAAPMVAMFVLDHDGIPLPDPYEVESNSIPMPDMRHPHFSVLISQEQIKLVSLPGMRQKKKEKVTSHYALYTHVKLHVHVHKVHVRNTMPHVQIHVLVHGCIIL